MAKISEDNKLELEKWLSGCPSVIRKMVKERPPNRLYRMTSSGHRVIILSYSENKTVVVAVLAKYNYVGFERRVFGIAIDDLVECDLPGPDEKLGATLSQEELAAVLASAPPTQLHEAVSAAVVTKRMKNGEM